MTKRKLARNSNCFSIINDSLKEKKESVLDFELLPLTGMMTQGHGPVSEVVK